MVSLMTGFDERGLLGFALHPGFAANGKIYTYTSEPVGGPADFTVPKSGAFDHQSVVAEWVVSAMDSNRVDPASRREILRIDQPLFSHNAGTLRFGPDGMLYIALGDGGGADDQGDGHVPGGNAQEPGNILGSVVRIDVDRTVGAPSGNGAYTIPPDNPFVGTTNVEEIYAFGFRNPFMFSFDMETGDLWAGDVGQNHIEEVNIVVSGGNYGWRHKEGSFFFDPNGGDNGFTTTVPASPVPAGLIDPVAEYDHGEGISVIGGFVYRGEAIPGLAGRYVFGEYRDPRQSSSGSLRYLDESNSIRRLIIGTEDRSIGGFIKGFGQDREKELYVCVSGETGPVGTTGRVYRIIPVP
jgi:glucose/arabinose dehydrogenase